MQSKVLVVLPSNFGDILLTLKAVNKLKNIYAEHEIGALCSPHTASFVDTLGFFDKVDIFDKKWSLITKYKYLSTFKNKYSVCIDFKHSLIPLIINAKSHTPMLRSKKKIHKSDMYIELVLKTCKVKEIIDKQNKYYLPQYQANVAEFKSSKKYVFIAAGSKSALKQLAPEKWTAFINQLSTDQAVVFVGAPEDKTFVDSIKDKLDKNIAREVIDMVGKTSFIDLFSLFANYAKVLICCDSAPMHVASYVDIPIIALFGPTDPKLYGPKSTKSICIQADNSCLACMQAKCSLTTHCMDLINVEQIIKAYEEI